MNRSVAVVDRKEWQHRLAGKPAARECETERGPEVRCLLDLLPAILCQQKQPSRGESQKCGRPRVCVRPVASVFQPAGQPSEGVDHRKDGESAPLLGDLVGFLRESADGAESVPGCGG